MVSQQLIVGELNPGEFSITWPFSASDVPLPAGPVDVRLQFDSDDLNSNDQEQFVDIYGIRSFIVFDYELPFAIRGREYAVDVFRGSHRSSFAPFDGEYALIFDGGAVWNETDPEAGRVTPALHPPVHYDPGDYDWNLSYGGSTCLSANSTSGVLRVRGMGNASASLSNEWSVRGSTNWISGFANDMVLQNDYREQHLSNGPTPDTIRSTSHSFRPSSTPIIQYR